MSRPNEPRVWEDVWFQVFALMAIVSGVFTAHYYLRHGLLLPRFSSAAPAAPSAQGSTSSSGNGASQNAAAPEIEVPLIQGPSGAAAPADATLLQSAAPAAPPSVAPAFSAAGPKTPGRWVVDPRMGADADCSTLAAALSKARDGDTILLMPGIYREGAQISKAVTILGGGASPEQVQLTHAGAQTAAVYGTQATLKNLSITNTGSRSAWAVALMKGSLTLQGVKIRTDGQGIRVLDATLQASDTQLDARIALAVEGRSRATLTRAAVSGTEAGIVAGGGGVAVRLEKSLLKECRGPAVEASRFAKVALSEVTASGNSKAVVVLRSGAEVRITRSTLSDNRDCGARIDGGVLTLDNVTVERGRCGVAFVGAGALEANGSRFSSLQIGALAVTPGLEKEIVVRGSGNIGLRIPTVQKRP